MSKVKAVKEAKEVQGGGFINTEEALKDKDFMKQMTKTIVKEMVADGYSKKEAKKACKEQLEEYRKTPGLLKEGVVTALEVSGEDLDRWSIV